MNKVIIVFLFLLTILPVTEVDAQEQSEIYVVTPDAGVKFRSTPEKVATNVIDALKQGYRVEKLDEQGDWMKVDYKGETGWVHKDYLSPFTADIESVYKAYIDILINSSPVKVIFYDFTQDGVEELYILEDMGEKPNYKQTIYSGNKVIYESTGESSIDIYSDKYNYYIVESGYLSRGETREISYFGDDADKIPSDSIYDGMVHTNEVTYYSTTIRPGNHKLTVNTFLKRELTSVEDDTFYMTEYEKNNQPSNQKQMESEEQLYANASNHESIYVYDVGYAYLNPSHNNTNTTDIITQIEEAYNEINDSTQNIEGLNEKEVDYFQTKVDQLISLSMPFSSESDEVRDSNAYLQRWEYALLMKKLGEPIDNYPYTTSENSNLFKYERKPIENFLYEFYGIKLKTDEYKPQDTGGELTSLDEDYYTCHCDGLGSGPVYLYHDLSAVTPIDQDYIAVEYKRYEVPGEFKITKDNRFGLVMANLIDTQYGIFKKIELEDGTHYPYVDTVDSIDSLDYQKYNKYVKELDMYKAFKETEKEIAVQKPLTKEKESNNTMYIIGGVVAGIIVLAGIVFILRRKKERI